MMTREEINKSPDRWLDFYPHTDFETICKTLLSVLASGAKSVWITGNLGTGKSNASLVIQKLFMDDESRVRNWFAQNATNGLSDRESLEQSLFDRRVEGTLVVYDYNADNIPQGNGLLVRLQKGIIAALNERNMSVPAMSSIDAIIARLEREGEHFFNMRDKIQSQLAFLTPDINTTNKLVNALRSETSSRLLSDVERVLREDSIYLSFDIPMFRKWLKAILESNNLQRVVYLFDEFHPFIETHSEQLKTFEDVTESPGVNRFFLVPITHMQLTAYMAEGSKNYLRANDRFYFCNLQMPNDTAFYLARRAINDLPETAAEWKDAKDELWDSVRQIIDKFNGSDDPKRERFYDILPIHPMAAFLLKHLSEQAKSNQRSFFEYLKGGADDTSFQKFIRDGGPRVPNKQYLTVDYLWNFFLGNRKELGVDNEIKNIAAFYKQTKERVFQNQTEDAPELRILKAVLLFCLLDKLAPGGHDRLKPTMENIEMSFKGDGTIADPVGIIEDLERKHCFSVTNGNISLFSISTVKQEDIEKWRDKFHDLLHEKTEAKLEEHTKNYRKYSSGRFDIRVSDASHTTLTNISQATRDRYTERINKDDGSICLWFVVAKNHDEQLAIPQKIDGILRQLNDHRILMFTFPHLSFCHSNKNLWSEYIRQYAQYMTENNTAAKNQIRAALDGIENDWIKELQKNDAVIRVHQFKNGAATTTDINWNQFRELITDYVRKTMKFSVDHLGFQDPHFGNSSLQAYAKAGITFSGSAGPIANLVNTLKKNGVTDDPN
jgi:predicted HicB family RNase H-like nuclease